MGLDAQLKDLSTDENLFTQFLNKFQKELNNFKANQTKLLQNKEKATQNNDKIKEQVIKSADDQTNFQKFDQKKTEFFIYLKMLDLGPIFDSRIRITVFQNIMDFMKKNELKKQRFTKNILGKNSKDEKENGKL